MVTWAKGKGLSEITNSGRELSLYLCWWMPGLQLNLLMQCLHLGDWCCWPLELISRFCKIAFNIHFITFFRKFKFCLFFNSRKGSKLNIICKQLISGKCITFLNYVFFQVKLCRVLFCFLYLPCVVLHDPSLMGFISKVLMFISSPILNGNKIVVQPHSNVQSCIMPL